MTTSSSRFHSGAAPRAASGRGRRGRSLIARCLALLIPVAAFAGYTIDDQRTAKRLNLVSEHLQADQYEEAEQVLNGMTLTRLNPYERSIVYQMYGYLANGREDYQKAAEYFEKAVAEEALPPAMATTMRFNIAQLYMALERWEEAIAALEQWFTETLAQEIKPNSNAYYTLAIAYYQLALDREDEALKEKALAPAKTAVEIATKPQERWLQLLLALYLEKKNYKKSLPILEQLVSMYPKKSYYLQLSAIYGELEMDQQSLAAQQLAYVQGMLSEDRELRRLAELYLYYEIPYRAARVMEKGFEEGKIEADAKSMELLANSLLAAKEYEKAFDPLVRAAELSETGNLFLTLGQLYIQREDWENAASALESAVEKGELRNPCNSELLLGIAHFNQGRTGDARTWFRRAGNDERCEDASQRWIQHVERESQQGG
jgi:tetratricopeptide (TPR) repeat protein